MTRIAPLTMLLLLAASMACSSGNGDKEDAAVDTAAADTAGGEVVDTATPDRSTTEVEQDSTILDTGPVDTGPADTGPKDAGLDADDAAELVDLAADLPPELPAELVEEVDLEVTDTGPVKCLAEPGQMCQGEWDCPAGCQCREQPCPKCGAPPPWYCVAPPCLDSCWTDEDCTGDLYCASANMGAGLMGRCLWKLEVPYCWNNSECPMSSKCHSAAYCPPCFVCSVIEKPGTCEADLGFEEVLLWLPDSLYGPGENVSPAWWNFSKEEIYLPGCSTYWVEKQDPDSGEWKMAVPQPLCAWEGIAVKMWTGAAHQAMTFKLPDDAVGNHRLHGQYWIGCKDLKPISEAECQEGPIDVYFEFFAGAAP